MLSTKGLQKRLDELRMSLKVSEQKFNNFRDELKSTKKEITDCRGAIAEVEKMLIQATS